MQVNTTILQRVAHITQDSIFFRCHDRGAGRFRQLVFKALGQPVDQALQLLHLGHERVAALGQFVLDGRLDGIRARFNDINTFRGIANGPLHPVDAVIDVLGGAS